MGKSLSGKVLGAGEGSARALGGAPAALQALRRRGNVECVSQAPRGQGRLLSGDQESAKALALKSTLCDLGYFTWLSASQTSCMG